MNKVELCVDGAYLLETDVYTDKRGAFETTWELAPGQAPRVPFTLSSAHHSYNIQKGTLRGLHYQSTPHEQAKLVSCVSGKTWDVMVDLRPESPTYLKWANTLLEAGSGKAVYIPKGCAHGFVTLQQHTTIAYLIDGAYVPQAAKMIRWDDPQLDISWPVKDPILSLRDQQAPLLTLSQL